MIAALLLLACQDEPVPTLIPTGWFVDTGDVGDDRCRHHLVSTAPAADTTWYARDPLIVRTNTSDPDRYDAFLHADGALVPTDRVDDPPGLRLVPRAPLAPDTDHVLTVRDCAMDHAVPFRTSTFGLPLDAPDALRDRTFALDFRDADWIAPDGVGPLLALYFDAPVLLGVRDVGPDALQLVLTIGENGAEGPRQDDDEPVQAFPPLPFTDSPFFAADVPAVPLPISGVSVPMAPFAFSGTFSPDGTAIGGGTLRGRADTRDAGILLSSSRPDAVCTFAAGLGVACVPCADGELVCLEVEVRSIVGTHVPGLLLE